MKNLLIILFAGSILFIQSCVGPAGPEGPQGLPGKDGGIEFSQVFEIKTSFTNANKYEAVFDFKPAIFESDMVVAFILWETLNNNKVWRPLPQSVFFDEGVLVYNFDFTRNDFRLFLETTFDPRSLGSDWTANQTFRVVVVPGEFANARLDLSNYEAVMKLINATEDDVVKLN
jgi:hypothetical protein